ncbi:MAG: DNA primase [Candidatus Krumholzibacteriota bacterium]|nr:DNA primase [Candidatus Krumholzibacteriota bacterium]
MIPEKIITDIREQTDIVQVIGAVLDLKRAGRNFKALCPFHGEKTPSFMVSPDKQIFHCFGCGKGGNVFNFIMENEGVSFLEAVRKLAQNLGINIDRYIAVGENRQKFDPYYRAMEFAGKYYREMLTAGPDCERARDYLEKRDMGSDIIDRFDIGYAPPVWDNLYRAAADAGISREVLLELRLIMRSRGGSGYRDYFRNRIIFPIFTVSNRLVGLAGRVLDNSEPKYLNSSESPIYSKGKILYGLNQSRSEIRRSEDVVIVEGYIDYLMLWMKGLRNICAVCGTALTEDQAHLLARYAKRVYIINDGDRAGVRAAVRAADQLLVEGLDIQVVVLPENEDPDSFVRKYGADVLRERMRSAPNYFTYLKAEAEKDPRRITQRKKQVLDHVLGAVSRVSNGVSKDLLLQELSGLFSIPVETLRTGLKAEKGKPRSTVETGKTASSKREQIQKEILRLGLEEKEYARMIVENLLEEDLEGELFREYYKVLDSALKNNIDCKSPDFIGNMKNPELSRLAAEIALLEPPPGPARELLADSLLWLKKAALRDELAGLKKRINELQVEESEESSREEVEIGEAYRKIAKELQTLGLKEDNRSDESR